MKTVATCPNCKHQAWTIYKDRIACSKCNWTHHFATGDEEPFAGPQLASELLRAVNQQSE